MKIPESVNVMSAPWSVHEVDKDEMFVHSEGDPDAIGVTLTKTMSIYVADWINDWQKRRVLIHELLHAIWYQNPLVDYTALDVVESAGGLEEAVLSGLDVGVLTIIKDNPKLVEWLIDNG